MVRSHAPPGRGTSDLRVDREVVTPLLTALACLLGGSADPVGGATIGQAQCDPCEIRLEATVRIGGPADSLGLLPSRWMPRDSRGRSYVATLANDGRIAVVDSTGRIVHTMARRGEGPGEIMGQPLMFVDAADSLHVFDLGSWTLSVFSPEHELARTVMSRGMPTSGYFLPSGEMIATARTSYAEGLAHPFHRISPTGEILESFGESGVDSPGGERRAYQLTPLADSTRFLAVEMSSRGFEVWSVEGELIETGDPSLSWFQDAMAIARIGTDPATGYQVPGVQVSGMSTDSDGMIWTATAVPDLVWADELRRAPADTSRRARPRTYDTVIEAIDPTTLEVIATRRIDEFVGGFAAPGRLFTLDDSGLFTVLTVWRLELRGAG